MKADLDDKVALDDYLPRHGTDALRQLMATAEPAGGINGINSTRAVPVGGGGERLNQLIPPVLGPDAYHGLVGEFLLSLSPLTEATDAAVLAHLLVAAGCVIGPDVFVYGGTRQPARINAVVVGPTSEGRKGTAWAIVREFLRFAVPDFLDSQVVTGLSTGEGLINKVADKVKKGEDGEEEVIPVDKRVLAVEEEFSKVMAQIRRDQNILSETVRQAFDSGDLGVLTRSSPLRANGTHICIVAHITPDELGERLTGTEQVNGFGNRHGWFYVRSDKILPRTAPVPDEVFAPLAKRLRFVANSPARCVPLSPDADALWCEELYPRLREDKPGLAGAMTARGTAFVLRLALIYCLMDEKKHRGAITVDHLKAAVAVWEYSVASAYLLFKSETGTALGDKLLSLLASGPMKRNQFTDHLGRPSEEIGAELDKLLAAGRVTKSKAKPSGAGRPAEVWELTTPGGN